VARKSGEFTTEEEKREEKIGSVRLEVKVTPTGM
jgi:hypothetical protein